MKGLRLTLGLRGGAAANPAHRYWRVKAVTLAAGAANFMGCSEVEMKTVASGTDQCTGGSGIADSTFAGFFISRAFDDDTSSDWACNGSGTAAYIGYDFGAGNEKNIIEVTYRVRGGANNNQIFSAANIDYSDDGTNWTTSWATPTGLTWAQNETKTFTKP